MKNSLYNNKTGDIKFTYENHKVIKAGSYKVAGDRVIKNFLN
jgi:hypothetical protein